MDEVAKTPPYQLGWPQDTHTILKRRGGAWPKMGTVSSLTCSIGAS